MRRCGRTTCLFGTGLIVAILMTGSALAAPGGNGKGQGAGNGDGQGNSQSQGLALAKGHEKHAAATPQLTSDPAPSPDDVRQEPAQEQSRSDKAKGVNADGAPGQATRHHHVTICHATGSGRYIVISPSVKGVENGHFRHHDDFVYDGSCSRGESPDPDPDPDPPAPPTGDHPPDPHGGVVGDVGARPRGNLPFTGMPALPIGLVGGLLVGAGWFLARRKPA
jgi:hypothetical protein